ncbi:MAG TPA: hypothetical protein PK559_15055, partial [Ignavibacteriaceae bacterium]|nr:hypothetical protein [Ignavibacteriaceae bacterium]
MKTIFKLVIIALVFSVVTYASENQPNKKQNSESPVAVVMKVVKDLSMKKEGAEWATAKIGQSLKTGDEVKTGDKS